MRLLLGGNGPSIKTRPVQTSGGRLSGAGAMTTLPLFLCRDVAVSTTGLGISRIATSRHRAFWTRIRALRRLQGSGRNGSMTRSGPAAGPYGTSGRACLVARNSAHHASHCNRHTVLMLSPIFQPAPSSIRAPLLEVRPGPTVSAETVALISRGRNVGIPRWSRRCSSGAVTGP